MLLVLVLLLLAEAVSRAASELSLGPVIAQVPLSALDTGVIVHYKGKGTHMRKGRPLPHERSVHTCRKTPAVSARVELPWGRGGGVVASLVLSDR